jgi:hypothetical protein
MARALLWTAMLSLVCKLSLPAEAGRDKQHGLAVTDLIPIPARRNQLQQRDEAAVLRTAQASNSRALQGGKALELERCGISQVAELEPVG